MNNSIADYNRDVWAELSKAYSSTPRLVMSALALYLLPFQLIWNFFHALKRHLVHVETLANERVDVRIEFERHRLWLLQSMGHLEEQQNQMMRQIIARTEQIEKIAETVSELRRWLGTLLKKDDAHFATIHALQENLNEISKRLNQLKIGSESIDQITCIPQDPFYAGALRQQLAFNGAVDSVSRILVDLNGRVLQADGKLWQGTRLVEYTPKDLRRLHALIQGQGPHYS